MLRFSRRNFHRLGFGVLFMIVGALFEGVQFSAIMPLADRVFNNNKIVLPEGVPHFFVQIADYFNAMDQQTLFYGIIFLIPPFFILKNLASFLRGSFMNSFAQKTVADVRAELFEKYQLLSLDFYSRKRQGELMTRITHDAHYLGHAFSYALTDLVYQTLVAVMFAMVAVTISWKMVLLIVVIFPINAVLIRVIGKVIKQQSINSQESMADLSSILSETNQGVSIVKAFSREGHEMDRFGDANKRYYKAIMKGIRRNLMLSPISEVLAAFAIVIVFWLGGKSVLSGEMSFGVFGWFVASLISLQRPIKKLAAVYGINQQALVASRRLYDILERKVKIANSPDAVSCNVPEHKIAFENVSFKYEKDKEPLTINNFSHNFEVGKTTALVGPTGCGKTTIMNLLLRFYDPIAGRILFDDQNIKDVTVESLRSHIGLVTQDMILFNETVRSNLQYGKLDATDTEIRAAAEKALAWNFIQNMPDGLDTVIGDRGFKLSGGQKQRLCIARAILKDPEILLLDEATSALDAESEFFVQKALDNLMEGRTVIVIAHRLSTIQHAACILVMSDGQIVQKGVHDELLNTSQLYAKLARYHFNQESKEG